MLYKDIDFNLVLGSGRSIVTARWPDGMGVSDPKGPGDISCSLNRRSSFGLQTRDVPAGVTL